MLKIYLESDDTLKVQLLPVMNKDTKTYILTGEKERKNYFDFMEGISFDVKIDEEGFVTEADK